MKAGSLGNLEINWQQHIDSWQMSDLSQASYCKIHQLKPHQFSYWKRKLSATNKSLIPTQSRFIKLIPDKVPSSSTDASPLCIRLPNDSAIEGIKGNNLHLIPPLIELLA